MAVKNNLKLVTEEAQSIAKRFDELIQKANKTEPKEKDVDALRDLLREHESEKLWAKMPDPMAAAQDYALQTSPAHSAFAECWRFRLKEIREELGYDGASQLEKLLISHITLSWLRLAHAELNAVAAQANKASLRVGDYHDKIVTACSKRFTRACESLVKTRRLMQRIPQEQGARKTA